MGSPPGDDVQAQSPPALTLTPDYIGTLIVKFRAVQAREEAVIDDSGSNPSDDRALDVLQETTDDLTAEELREEIRGIGPAAQAEIVALTWIGRGDAEPEEWLATVELAEGRREIPTEEYLLEQPLVAEWLAEGLEKLGLGSPF
jgi:hypothetical protein